MNSWLGNIQKAQHPHQMQRNKTSWAKMHMWQAERTKPPWDVASNCLDFLVRGLLQCSKSCPTKNRNDCQGHWWRVGMAVVESSNAKDLPFWKSPGVPFWAQIFGIRVFYLGSWVGGLGVWMSFSGWRGWNVYGGDGKGRSRNSWGLITEEKN